MNSLNGKKGGLIMSCHNQICHRVVDLAIKALTPTHVSNDPLIRPGGSMESGKAFQTKSNLPNKAPETAVDPGQKVKLLIR